MVKSFKDLIKAKSPEKILKFNNNHDPKTGRFTSGSGGTAGPQVDAQGGTLTDGQQKFFAGSQAVNEDGELLVMYHGTVSNFTEFDTSLGNPANDMGQGIYLTNASDDADGNYGSERGPDLRNKINRYAEMLQDQGMDYEEADQAARDMFIKSEPQTLECYVNVKNPVKLGGKDETFFDFDEGYDSETDEYGEPSGKLIDFFNKVEEAVYSGDFEIYDDYGFLESVQRRLFEDAYDGGITADDAIRAVKDASFEHEVYKETAWGDVAMAGSELARKAIEDMGYDGIIDNTVYSKFRMNGVDSQTTHIIVFNSNQVKLTDNQNPTDSQDITKKVKLYGLQFI